MMRKHASDLPDLLLSSLTTQLIGGKIIYHPRLDSTMNAAREMVKQGAPEGCVIITDEQTSGKGRIKRAWLSPEGCIALSIILYPGISSLPYLVMLTSLAVAHSIEKVSGIKPQLKWPNDVLINGKKVCGILIESDVRGSKVTYTIIGIGINVNLRLSEFPELATTATSLSDELGRSVSRVELIRCLFLEIERLYLTLPDGEAIYTEWRDRLVTLGQQVQVTSGDSITRGVAESVDRDGSLWLRQPDGNLTRIIAGDVTLRANE